MSRRRSGADLPPDTSSERDSTSTSELIPSTSTPSDSSKLSAESEDSSLPTPGTEEIEPQIIITFAKQGIEFAFSDGLHTVNMATIERATLLMRREVMKERRKLAHQNPSDRNAGWDNSHEREKVNVA